MLSAEFWYAIILRKKNRACQDILIRAVTFVGYANRSAIGRNEMFWRTLLRTSA